MVWTGMLVRVMMPVLMRAGTRRAGSFVRAVRRSHDDLNRSDAATLDVADLHRNAVEAETPRYRLEPGPRRAGGDECSEQHVAADAGAGIQDREACAHSARNMDRAHAAGNSASR